jgi:Plasmid maintenance system killer protein
MIKCFKDKETEKIFKGMPSKKFPQDIQQRAHNKLLMINSSGNTDDLRNPPSNYLKKLEGKRKDE